MTAPTKKKKKRGISDHPKTALGKCPSNFAHNASPITTVGAVGVYENYKAPTTPPKKRKPAQ